jgi:ribosomal protein S9
MWEEEKAMGHEAQTVSRRTLRRSAETATLAVAVILGGAWSSAQSLAPPIARILTKFTAPDVPKFGDMEIAVRPRRNTEPTAMTLGDLPGNGLAQHPMVYIGEGDNTISTGL